MTLSTDNLVIPAFPTRNWLIENLGLTRMEIRRLDEEGLLKRHPGFGKPVKYYGHSVREFLTGR